MDAKPEKETPPDGNEVGRAGWTLLHTIASQYPKHPTEEQKKHASQFISLFAEFYPCKVCATDMIKSVKESPPMVDDKASFSLWLCNLHNHVNEKTGKPTFDCNKLMERWGDEDEAEDEVSHKEDDDNSEECATARLCDVKAFKKQMFNMKKAQM